MEMVSFSISVDFDDSELSHIVRNKKKVFFFVLAHSSRDNRNGFYFFISQPPLEDELKGKSFILF